MSNPERKTLAGLYTVELSIQGLRHRVVTALADHDGTMQASVQAAVDAAIEKFDFPGEVQRICHDLIRQEVGNAIRQSITDATWTKPMQTLVKEVTEKAIKRAVLGL
jgi:hypothetical protein